MATVNLDKSEYDTLVASTEVARRETAAVRVELDVERAKPTDEKLAACMQYIEASKPVIDYAVGNLSPEFTRDWPVDAMKVLADQVAVVGPVTQRDRERAEIWTLFCADIAKYERERQVQGPLSTVEDIDDPAIQKMHDDISRGLAGELIKDVTPTRSMPWVQVLLAVIFCATLIVIARMFAS